MENDKNILLYILTGDRSYTKGLFRSKVIQVSKRKPKTPKKLSRRQKRAQEFSLRAETERFKYSKVRSYSDRIESHAKIYGMRIMSNVEELEFNPRQSPCHLRTTQIKNVGPQPLRHFGL